MKKLLFLILIFLLTFANGVIALLPTGHYDYILITDDSFVSAAQPLIDWKNSRGIESTVVDLSYIYSNYDGEDNSEKIRNFLIDAHNNWGVKYVALGGDVEIVPTKSIGNIPTDYYYAGLDANWEDVYTDADWYPEVYIGRLPADTSNEMSTIVTKTINFESSDFTTNNILMLGARCSAFYDGKRGKESIAEYYVPLDYDITKLYETDGTLNKTAVIDNINSGYKLINVQSHGNQHGLYKIFDTDHEILTHLDIPSLTNGNKLAIFYAVACSTGDFTWDDCLGELLVKKADSGVINFIGLSGSPLCGSYPYDGRFFKEYFKGHIQPAKALYISKRDYGRSLSLMANLLGDPIATVKTGDSIPDSWIYKPKYYEKISSIYRILIRAIDDNEINEVKFSINDSTFDITSNYDGIYYFYDLDTTTLIEDSFYTINASVTDSASQTYSTPITYMKINNVPDPDLSPTCIVYSPGPGTFDDTTITKYGPHNENPYRILISASDDLDLTKVEISIDSGDYIDITFQMHGPFYYYNWDLTDVSIDYHTIDARATDNSSQVTDANQVLVNVIPSVPPLIHIEDPLHDSVINEIYDVWVFAHDHVNLTKVEVSIDSGEFIDITENEEWSGEFHYYWDTTTVLNGEHTIDARATDNDSQVTYAEPVYVIVNNINSCTDTDGGFEPEVKGTVSGYQDGEYYSYTDYCGGGTYINEYSCDGSSWQVELYDCGILGSNYYCSYSRKRCVQYVPPPGGGCPILKVYNGNEFVTIEKLDIHAPEYQDKIVTTSFTMKSINGKYEIILDEAAYIPLDGSHIDYVKLIDESGKECELLSAVHSKHGDVLLELIKSDDVRIQTFPSENIKLAYTCSGNRFEFIIEGYNRLPMMMKGTLPYLLGVTIPAISFIILVVIEVVVIFLIIKKLHKGHSKKRKR